MSRFLLVIDQGTTSTRAMIFNLQGKSIGTHQIPLTQYFPQPGWVEHDAEEIWQAAHTCCVKAVEHAQISFKDIAAIGITNQRETTVIWDKKTGTPIYKAIVWQDRRTADYCKQLHQAGHEKLVQEKTGLLLDPYFCASKIHWLLEHIPDARKKANDNQLAFGTIDSFLLWKLTQGQVHSTDITNASRTLLFNIHTRKWDDALLDLFDIPKSLLPEVFDNDHPFGSTHPDIFGNRIPIAGIAGDQQAALIGQTCFQPGMVKSTYGTGAFLMLNMGEQPVISQNRLLTTIGYRLNGKTTYALEGSIFSAGVIVQWLRDKLGIIKNAEETEALAASVKDNGGIYFVPAFTGLGAPYWVPDVRANIHGITRDTERAHIVRAGLEAIAFQTRDLLNLMLSEIPTEFQKTGKAKSRVDKGAKRRVHQSNDGYIRVDGGMVINNWLMQFLSDILNLTIERPVMNETTALGAAYLAGLNIGLFDSLEQISQLWQCDKHFEPQMDSSHREDLYLHWQGAVKRLLLPKQHHSQQANIEALKEAALQLESLLASNGLSVDELVAEFRSLRKEKN